MPTFLLSAVGNIGSMVGGIASALGSVVQTVGGILQTGAKLVMSAVQSIASGLMAVGGLIVRGVTMFVSVLLKATKGAMDYAKSVNDLRLGSGMSMKEAGAVSMKFGSFGISPQMLAQARGGDHESVYKMRGAAWGVDFNDPMAINRKARSFGNDAVGHAQRESFLESAGMNTDKGRWMASLSEGQMQDQMNFTQKTGAALGVSPESMSKMAEALPLAQAKLETFLQMVQLKFVDSALPMMEQGIAALSDFISQNAPMISQVFSSAMNWIFKEGPKFIMMAGVQFLGMLSTLVGGMAQVTQWLSENAGQVLSVFDKILDGVRTFIGLGLSIFNAFKPKPKKEDKESALDKAAQINKTGSDNTNPALMKQNNIVDKNIEVYKRAGATIGISPGQAKESLKTSAVDHEKSSALMKQNNIVDKNIEVYKRVGTTIGVSPGQAKESLETSAVNNEKSPTRRFFDLVPNSQLVKKTDTFKATMKDTTANLLDKQKSIDEKKAMLERQLASYDQIGMKPEEKPETAQKNANNGLGRVNNVVGNVSTAVNNKDVVQSNRQADEDRNAIRKATEKTADNTGKSDAPAAGSSGVQDWLARFAVERSRQRYLQETR